VEDDFRVDQDANCRTVVPKVCNFTKHEKSGKISASVQCQARFNLNFEEKLFAYACNLDVFCDKRNGNTANEVWLFSGL